MSEMVLQIMNYAASYRGNFMDSLKNLDNELKKNNMKNIYLFCKEANQCDAKVWIDQMIQEGEIVEFLSDRIWYDLRLIKKIIKKYNVQIIHTHFITMQQYLAIYGATFGTDISVIMHFHNHSKETSNYLKNSLRRLLYRKCRMISCSESVYDSVVRDYPANKKEVVDNGVNFSRLDSYSVMTNSEYGVADNEKIFLIFGFDYYRKGVDLAVEALKKLRNSGYRFNLIISLSRNFEEVENNICKSLGSIPEWIKIIKARNDVASLYNSVDVFLSPSREEGLPYSVIEAGYSECCIVLSDISAQAKLKLKYAVWFESENIEDFSKAILNALEQCEEKKENIREVREYMKECYSLEQWSNTIASIYLEEIN